MMKTGLLYLYTESPLHAGTGSGLSAIDLPIQRERTTQYPNIHGSGLKGALRSQCNASEAEISLVFGPETGEKGSEHAGAVSLGEARTVLFPVRSLAGIFAYATCAHVIARLLRDASQAGLPNIPTVLVPPLDEGECLVSTAAQHNGIVLDDTVVLDEFSFHAQPSQEVDHLATWLANNALPAGNEYQYWREKLPGSLVLLPENAFRDFVLNGTEIVTRVRLQPDSKTVKAGALWTQEAIPADTLMVSSVTSYNLRSQTSLPQDKRDAAAVSDWLTRNLNSRIQVGGDETTGLGIVSLRWQMN